MTIKQTDVEKMAHLARLSILEENIPYYTDKLSNILDLVAKMQQVDTQGVEPMAHPFAESQRLRVDEVTETDQHEKFQKLAPNSEADLYLVPQVIE